MNAILKKELQSFFNSPLGFLIIGVFLILSSLFLWVFKGDFNILDYGFADLSKFFLFAPWIFLFIIPAITMKSFSEEYKMGTMELLLIKPIGIPKIILGKYLGTLLVSMLMLVPTLVYVFCIGALGMGTNNYDLGVIIGSYFGLFFLIGLFHAIGLFASTVSNNQIFSFLLGVLLCFLIFFGFDALASLLTDGSMQELVSNLGANAHFNSIARGIIDTRDLVYFISLILFFLCLSYLQIKNKR